MGHKAIEAVGRLWLDLRPGQVVAEKYFVMRPLGQGGLSQIFQVRDIDLNHISALKLPLPESLDRLPATVFFDEAEAWLEPAPHPNLVTCEMVMTILGLPAIFMEYVPGGDLAQLMDKGDGPLYQGGQEAVTARILDIFIQVARGLSYAHSLGLSQVDIKPRNILVGRGGRVLVSDYGPLTNLAKSILTRKEKSGSKLPPGAMAPASASASGAASSSVGGTSQSLLTYTQLMGTHQYFSPEAALGLPGSEKGADLWALALTALECFLGRRLWEMGTMARQALDYYLAQKEPEPRVRIPDALVDFFHKALAEKPQDRFQSAPEVEKELIGLYKTLNGKDYARPEPAPRQEDEERLEMKEKARADLARERKKYA